MPYRDNKPKHVSERRPRAPAGARRDSGDRVGSPSVRRLKPNTLLSAGFASCPRGLEELLADELKEMGIDSARATAGGASFDAGLSSLYTACLWSRVASRVMLVIADIEANDAAELYRGVLDLPWERHIDGSGTMAVDFIGISDSLRNSQFSAQRVKDGIVDRLRAHTGARPDVDLRDPDLRIIARLYRGRCTLSLDFSGSALHRRGYRLETGAAPLKETLAAAILIRAGWPSIAARGGALYDPMCGSATLLIEGALMAADIAPGLGRELTPRRWPEHDRALWDRLVSEAKARRSAVRHHPVILGADIDPRVIDKAQENIRSAGLEEQIQVCHAALGQDDRPDALGEGLLVCNPPYGERIGAEEGLERLYAELGEQIRTRFDGWQAAVLTADGPLTAGLGLRWDRQYKLRNGTIDCRLLVFAPTKVLRGERREHPDAPPRDRAPVLNEGATMLANRLRKNQRRLKAWLATAQTDCYRVYDADLPEYAVAIDRYADHVHIAEYAPPATVDPAVAQQRLKDVRAAVMTVFAVDPARIALKTRARQRGNAQYQRHARAGELLEVREGEARLLVNLRDYLDTGLFLDHRRVRRYVAEMASGKRFLNLFCYTASVTVQAALAGASESLSVDMSATYLEWAEQNFRRNGLDLRRHRLERADCLTWPSTKRARWDLIFLDPPSFSNSKRMEDTLDVQRDHVRLIRDAVALLVPGGVLVFSTNRRGFKLDREALEGLPIEDLTESSYDPDFARGRTRHSVYRLQSPGRASPWPLR